MEFEALLRSLSAHESEEIRWAVAQNPLLRTSELIRLCKDPDPWVRLNAAANPRCAPETAVQIVTAASETDDPQLLQVAAGHVCCPPAALARLATHEDSSIRSQVASNGQTPAAVLSTLLFDTDERVAVQAAGNPGVPLDVLRASDAVKEAAARSTVVPEEVLLALAEDPQLQGWVASNSSASPDVLKAVLTKSGRLALLLALANPACPPVLLTKYAKNPRLHDTIAKNTHTPPETLRSLYDTGGRLVLRALAANPSCPADVLAELFKTRSLQYTVSSNPGASTPLLETMAQSRDGSVRHGVAKNPSCPEPLLAHLALSTEVIVLRGVAANRNPPVSEIPRLVRMGMWHLLEHPRCPERAFLVAPIDVHHTACLARYTPVVSQLAELAGHADPMVRNAVAHNARCPLSLLVRLLGDENDFIAHAVIEVLGGLSNAHPARFDVPVPSTLGIRLERVLPPTPGISPIDPALRNRMFTIENAPVLYAKIGWDPPEEDAHLLVSDIDDARDLDGAVMVDKTYLDVAVGPAADRVRSGELQIVGTLLIHQLEAETIQQDLDANPDQSACLALDLEYRWTLLCSPDGHLWIVTVNKVSPIRLMWQELVLGPPDLKGDPSLLSSKRT